MNRVKLSAKGLLLISGIGIAATGLAGVALAAVQPSSVSSAPTTVVIRGSSDTVVPLPIAMLRPWCFAARHQQLCPLIDRFRPLRSDFGTPVCANRRRPLST
jgi:hypothetical protein